MSGSKSYSKFFDEKSRTPAGNIKCLDTASSYAVQKMLKDLPTPSKPRPDTSSAQVSAAISNPSGILSTVQFKLWGSSYWKFCNQKTNLINKLDTLVLQMFPFEVSWNKYLIYNSSSFLETIYIRVIRVRLGTFHNVWNLDFNGPLHL